MDGASHDYRKYLDARVLAKISPLELRARLIVEGFYTGMHRSPRRGVSIEYADHRAYVQGDDIRHIDWKVFGRTDKHYIKEYEQETNLELMIVVDASASMAYRSDDDLLSKYDYAASLAAAMAYLTLQQQDSVGIALFDESLRDFVRPSTSAHHWQTIIKELLVGAGGEKTSLDRVLTELAEKLKHRTLIVLISDLFDDEEHVLTGLKRLRYRHHELIVWNIWDPAELHFAFRGPTMFQGLEREGELLVEPRGLRERYLEEVDSFLARIRGGCGKLHVDFASFDTASPLDAALSGYLATRSARLRARSSRVLTQG